MMSHSRKMKPIVIASALTLLAIVGVKTAYHILLSKLHNYSLTPAVRSALPHLKEMPVSLAEIVSKPGGGPTHSRVVGAKKDPGIDRGRAKSPKARSAGRLDPNLRLIGTACGSPEEARAVIMDTSRGTQRLCKIGDPLSGGLIGAISRDQVVVRFHSGDGILNMVGANSPRAEKSAVFLRRTDLQKALKNANAVLSALEIRPFAGERNGIEIAGVKAGSFIDELGLKNGDVINEFDGKSVTDPKKFATYFNRLKPILPALLAAGSNRIASNSPNRVGEGISRNLSNFIEKIGSRDTLSIVVTRDGKAQTITYGIQ